MNVLDYLRGVIRVAEDPDGWPRSFKGGKRIPNDDYTSIPIPLRTIRKIVKELEGEK